VSQILVATIATELNVQRVIPEGNGAVPLLGCANKHRGEAAAPRQDIVSGLDLRIYLRKIRSERLLEGVPNIDTGGLARDGKPKLHGHEP
jgi:hypothetical protein